MSANTTRMQRANRPLSLGCAIIALATAIGGCTRLDENTAADLHDVTNRHPVSFASNPETLYVEVPSGSQRLSPDQEADIYRFVSRYKSESTGTLRIGAPRSVAGHLKSSGVGRQIESIVHSVGIDDRSVETLRNTSGGPAGPTLSLSYDRTVALAPQCGDWGTSLGENRERLPFNNFGCATQRNFALNVANARDLQQPQDEAQRSSERRSASWSKYIDNKGGGGGGSSVGAAGAAAAPGAPPASP